MATEKIKFKLELFATMWDLPPHVKILINDTVHFDGDINGTEQKPDVISFEHELEEDQEYTLTIKRTGKVVERYQPQTVTNSKGKVCLDQLLHIKGIEIDEIDIGSLVYEGVYHPFYQEPWATEQREAGVNLPKSYKNVTHMGHDGEWRFKFSSPFYQWLLENLY